MDFDDWDMRTPWHVEGFDVVDADGSVVAFCGDAHWGADHRMSVARLVADAVNASAEANGLTKHGSAV